MSRHRAGALRPLLPRIAVRGADGGGAAAPGGAFDRDAGQLGAVAPRAHARSDGADHGRGHARREAAAAAGESDVTARLEAARSLLASLDLAVAPSAALARDLARFGLPPERTVVADYGFEPWTRARPHRAGGPLRIGFVGTLTWHKGAHVLLEAARALRGAFEIRIAGDRAVFPDYAAELTRLAEGLPVTFTGRFERAGAAAIYDALDVLVVPSLWPENSPLVIHEAFMSGVPVVGARTGGIPELVTDGVSGLLFDAGRPASLAAALQRLVDAPALASALGARCPAVRTLDQDAREWEARYEAVLAARARRSA